MVLVFSYSLLKSIAFVLPLWFYTSLPASHYSPYYTTTLHAIFVGSGVVDGGGGGGDCPKGTN